MMLVEIQINHHYIKMIGVLVAIKLRQDHQILYVETQTTHLIKEMPQCAPKIL